MSYYSYSNFHYQDDYNPSDYYSFNSNHSASYPLQHDFSNYISSSDFQNFAFDPFPSTISYSVSIPTDSSYFQYQPAPVQFSISYSVAEFNEPDFEEYDPTPYGGGYNLALTYGDALPPSDETCYPRSGSAPPVLPSSAVPSAAGKIEAESKPTHSAAAPPALFPPAAGKTEAEIKPRQSDGAKAGAGNGNGNNVVIGNDAGSRGEEESGSFNYGSGSRGEYGYGYGYGAGQVPYGYGLEAMDICESLFGYWPCISRYRRELRDYEQVGRCENCSNPWDRTVDYLFGSTNPYEEPKFENNSVGNCMYSYRRVDDSWS